MKKAAIYDRWLYTLGGGEQVAFGYAQMLRDLGYKTSILTHVHIDREKAQSKLSVNLTGITIEYLPPLATEEISPFTEKYDLFVNTSYLDYFPSRAKINILSVFFPGKICLSPFEYIKRALAIPSMRRFFIYPTSFEGFSYSQYVGKSMYHWLGKESFIIFNQDIYNLTLFFFLPKTAMSAVDGLKFYVNEKEIKPNHIRLIHQENIVVVTFKTKFSKNARFGIVKPVGEYGEKIALVDMTVRNTRFLLYNWFKKLFPIWELRLHGGPGVTRRSDLQSYDRIITISQFSRMWIQKYWGLESRILYPTTDTSKFKSSANKKNWILHVGRFFVSGHSKKQLEMARAFTKLVSSYGVSDWELHFVGSVHDGERHQEYFEHVKLEAQGYPVFFHTDVASFELKELLAQAKIYWHATGLDENEKTQPILFEHFGITTVEAMSSGCVPVVINAGGQREIVTPQSGFLWNTREELIKFTLQLIEDEKKLKMYSAQAIKRSAFFDKKQGVKRFEMLLGEIKKEKNL